MNTKKKSVPAFVRKPEFVTIIILIVMIIVVAALQGNFFAPSSSEYDHFLDTDHSSYNRTGSCNYFRWLGYVQW